MEDPAASKKGRCSAFCQGRLCLPLLLLVVVASIAAVVAVVLLAQGVRKTYDPDHMWWQRNIVYQVYPRSFQDTDDDGVGDIKGITSRLDHLQYLNVGAVWISPFYPSPLRDFGYDITNFTDVDPRLGNLTDIDDLIAAAHKKGIKVVVDFVAGHTSSDHPWFLQSVNRTAPYTDYYIWADGKKLGNGTVVEPSNWMSAFGYSAWTWMEERQQYYYHAFLPQQPTLNYRNPAVVTEMQNVIRFWLERGVDGIRVDAVSYIWVSEDYHQDQARSLAQGAQWWQRDYYINNLTQDRPEIGPIVRGWRAVLDEYSGVDDSEKHKLMIVELYDPPKVRNLYYGYGADMPFNFDLLLALDNVNHPSHNACDAICIHDVIKKNYDQLPKGKWPNFALSNHDNPRSSSRMGRAYVDAMHVLLLTLRGTPTTYYGEEIGMADVEVAFNQSKDPYGLRFGEKGYMEVSRDPERSPMQWDNSTNAGFTNSSHPWLPVGQDFETVNVEYEKNSPNMTTLKVYRDLARLRQEPAFRYGHLVFGDVTSCILAYSRHTESDKTTSYLVAINLGNDTETRDFTGSPFNKGHGRVKVVTSQAANEGRYVKDSRIDLTGVSLEPGDGIVVRI